MYKTVFLTSYSSTIYGVISRYWRAGKDGSMYLDRLETFILPNAPMEQEGSPEESLARRKARAPKDESPPVKKVILPT
jgi:hypothetical protein